MRFVEVIFWHNYQTRADIDNKDCNLFQVNTFHLTTISAETGVIRQTSTVLARSAMGTTGSTVVDAIDIPVLNVDEGRTGESIRDLILTLAQGEGAGDVSTAIESSLSTASGLFSDHCISGISIFSSGSDDDDNNNGDGNHVNDTDDKE
ncbi:unnamed protein product, partial [Cercopithifilaria johnstoni]